ncbi:5271_t:CDS:2 [Funneliformis caledonium]|uniref:5271_t:CDS:1 n=1 Tax=Funneliformis caledonium TaxID=1117310 RepID=A0A9N9HDR3_9GLOM|nr:5271_t:CDS:2 [Funneliformis caledonium]
MSTYEKVEEKLEEENLNEEVKKNLEERKYRLLEEKKELEKDKKDWTEQVKEWGKALREFAGGKESLKRKPENDQEEAYIKKIKGSEFSPSEAAKPINWRKIQLENSEYAFYNHRPADASGNPVTLQHEIIANLYDDLRYINPTARDYDFALKINYEMSGITFSSEDERRESFKTCIYETYKIALNQYTYNNITTDGTILGGNGKYMLSNLEVKPEMGTVNCCPANQTLVYYAKHVANEFSTDTRSIIRLPCILLYLAGPYIGMAGAIQGNKFLCDPLSPTLPLLFTQHYQEYMLSVAKFFAAYKKALDNLGEYYKNPSHDEPSQLSFPYIRSYKHLDTNLKINFRYIKQLHEDKLLFLIELEDEDLPSQLIVKFAKKYGNDAHLVCANLDIAPKLFGIEKVSGGWFMVVMEYLDGYEAISEKPSAQIQQQICTATQKMHQAGYVHGDLRHSNILTKITNGNTKVVFIDYDWADGDGKATYPPFLNLGIPRHHDVSPGGHILKEHDEFMVNKYKN